MFREICLVLAISFTVSRAYCQSFNAADLIKLISLSDSQITRFLTNDKHFILLSNKTIGNEMTKTFVTNNNITEIILTTRAKNATRNYKIEYDVDPKSYADSIIQQLIKMKFKLKSVKRDENINSWHYISEKYTIDIYKFYNALPATIQVSLNQQ